MGHKVTRPGGVEPPASSSAGKRSIHLSYGRSLILAERLGFEPRVDLSGLHALSRRAPSTTRPPLLNDGPYRQDAPYIDERRARDSNPHEPRGPVDFKSTALPVRTSPPNLWMRHGQERPLLPHGHPARNIYTGYSRMLWWCHSSSLGGVGQHLVIGRRISVFDAAPEPISSPAWGGETMRRFIVRTHPRVAPDVSKSDRQRFHVIARVMCGKDGAAAAPNCLSMA